MVVPVVIARGRGQHAGHAELVHGRDPTSWQVVTGGQDGTVRTYRCTVCGRVEELIPVARVRLAAIARG